MNSEKRSFLYDEVWLHVPTFTIGIVVGNFLEFRWNGRHEESFFGIVRNEGEWVYIGQLN